MNILKWAIALVFWLVVGLLIFGPFGILVPVAVIIYEASGGIHGSPELRKLAQEQQRQARDKR